MAARLQLRLLARQLGPFLLCGACALAMHPQRNWLAVLLNPFLFIALLFSFTALHEAGHALAALALGMSVWRVHFGFGHLVAAWKLGATELRLGVVPLGGATLVLPRRRKSLRMRMWLGIAAGPAVNAVMVVLLWQVALTHPSLEVAPVPLALGANVVLLVGSLVPLRASTALGVTETDGRQLLTLPFVSPIVFDEMTALPAVARAEEARDRGDYEAALLVCERGLEDNPSSVILRNSHALVMMDLARFEPARQVLRQLVGDPGASPNFLPLFKNNLAWVDAMLGDPRWIGEADELSLSVIRQMPRASWANGTRGAVLVRLGKFRSATETLTRAWATNQSARARAHNAAWLAAAQARLGNDRAAREWWETARSLDPDCYSIAIVRGLVGF